jgi:ABC-type nitrate/sulfonate/bicarbonate transport system substrate-binding protein
MEGQGEAPTQTKPDLTVFMGGDNGFLSLVTVPEVKSVADLKGRTVSVDARTTGYAFVLFDLLKRKGLNDGDYNVEKAGGVLQRWEALKEKKHDGTLLLTPFEFIAKANGFNVLEYAIDVYGHYQGIVGTSRRGWAADNPRKVQAFVKGYADGVDFLLDPKHKAEAIAILRKHVPQMSEQLAEQSYSYMAGPKGFTPKARIDMDGVRKVLELRSAYGEPKKALTDPAKYYDAKYYDAAMR